MNSRGRKMTLAVLTLGLWLPAAVRAQAQAVAPTNAPPAAPAPQPPATRLATDTANGRANVRPLVNPALLETPRPIPEDRFRYGGLVGQAAQMEQPLQLVNPLAPAEYGDGTQNLSADVHTGKARGVIFLSISLQKKSGAKKPKKPKAGKP